MFLAWPLAAAPAAVRASSLAPSITCQHCSQTDLQAGVGSGPCSLGIRPRLPSQSRWPPHYQTALRLLSPYHLSAALQGGFFTWFPQPPACPPPLLAAHSPSPGRLSPNHLNLDVLEPPGPPSWTSSLSAHSLRALTQGHVVRATCKPTTAKPTPSAWISLLKSRLRNLSVHPASPPVSRTQT